MKHIVYLTTNKVNNKVYVGVHKTSTPEKFDNYLGCGVRTNSYKSKKEHPFQKAVNKYGPESFSRHTLFICDTRDEAYEIESKIVTMSWVKSSKNYNVALGGGSGSGTHSAKTIFCYTLEGDYIRSYDSIHEASIAAGIDRGSINHFLDGNSSHAGGFMWSLIKVLKLECFVDGNITEIFQYSRTGEYITSFKSMNSAAKSVNAKNTSSIVNCASGRRNEAYGFIWSYDKIDKILPTLKRNIPVIQMDMDGTFIQRHDSAKDAALYLKKSIRGNITSCCTGNRKSAGGYTWKFE